MPISDEVIELAPVQKTKKKLVFMFVGMGVLLALAVTFLVMYLLKPNLPTDTSVVKEVTVASDDLFSVNENGVDVKYASVGHKYTLTSTITAENGASDNIVWEFDNAYIHADGPVNEPTFSFIPDASAHGRDVTIKVRSSSDAEKSASVTFKIVNQGTESIVATKYYPEMAGGVSNAETVTDDTIKIPYYLSNSQGSNKSYVLLFEQYGKYNNATGEYSPITEIETDKGSSTAVSAVSSNDKSLHISRTTPNGVYFTPNGVGEFTITVTANINNPDAPQNVVKQVKVIVQSNAELGYIEEIYLFDKAVVDAEFISGYVRTDGTLNTDKLNADFKGKDPARKDVRLNPTSITLPYDTTYDDIFSHILIDPVTVQYDVKTGELKNDWFKKISVASNNENAVKPTTGREGAVSLRMNALANALSDSTCRLTFTDTTKGSIGKSNYFDVNVVASNTEGTVTATNTVSPDVTVDMSVNYILKMPGRTETESVLKNGFMSNTFILDYDKDKFTVTFKGSDKPIEPGKETIFPDDAFKIVGRGTEGASSRIFDATAIFSVTVESDTADGAYSMRFTKLGTSVYIPNPDDAVITDKIDKESNKDWSRTIELRVTKKATRADFIVKSESDTEGAAKLLDIITKNGAYAGEFKLGPDGRSITLFIQQLSGETLYFDIEDIVTADAIEYDCSVDFKTIRYPLSNNNGQLQFEVFNRAAQNTVSDIEVNVHAAGSTASLGDAGKLSVHINVIDAVDSFERISDNSAQFDKTKFSPLHFDASAIKVRRVLDGNSAVYSYSGINIYPGSPSTDGDMSDVLKLVQKESKFYHVDDEGGETELFSYDRSSFNITPSRDLYAYSVHTGIDFTHITVQFLMSDGEYYSPENTVKPSAFMRCTFNRTADGFRFYSDAGYSREFAYEDVTTDGGNVLQFTDKLNHDTEKILYISALIDVGDSEPIVAKKNLYAHVPLYIKLLDELDSRVVGSQSDPVPGQTHRYYHVMFRLPKLSAGVETASYEIYSSYGPPSVGTPVVLVIQNNARKISSIEVTDGSGTALNGKDLAFGYFKSGSYATTHSFDIKVTYEAYNGKVTYFQAVDIDLPAYLTLKVDGKEFTGTTLVPSDAVSSVVSDTDATFVKTFKCEVSLNPDKKDNYNIEPDITIQAEQNVDIEPITVHTEVKTGLESITFDGDTIAAGGTKPVAVKITVESVNGTLPSVSFPFAVKTLDSTYGIPYDLNNLGINVVGADGWLGFNNAVTTSQSIGFSVVLATLKAQSKHITVTFTDTVSGSTFIVDFAVTVEVGIFDVAFADGTSEFIITTDNKESVATQDIEFGVSFNNHVSGVSSSDIQPTDAVKNGITVKIVEQNEVGVYMDYRGSDYVIEGNAVDGYTLKVNNMLVSGGRYYVCINDNIHPAIYRTINVSTDSNAIELNVNDVADKLSYTPASEGKNALAEMVISDKADTFALPVKIYNKGDVNKTALSGTVKYELFADAAMQTHVDFASIDESGVFGIIDGKKPDKNMGTLHYKASYTDAASGVTQEVIMEIRYTVAVKSVSFNDLYDAIVLYYVDEDNYSWVDLEDSLEIFNAFGEVTDLEGVEMSADYNGNLLDISNDGKQIKPMGLSQGEKVTGIVRIGKTSVEKTFTVQVLGITAPILDTNMITIDLSDPKAFDVTATLTDYEWLKKAYTFTLKGESTAVKAEKKEGAGDYTYTVSLGNRAASNIGEYIFTARAEYIHQSMSTEAKTRGRFTVKGHLAAEAVVTVNVVNNYQPTFDLYWNSGEDGATDELIKVYDSTVGTAHTIKSSGVYKVKITNLEHGDTSATYVATNNDVIKFGTFESGVATFTVNANASGEFNVDLSATVYGRTINATPKKYNFAYGEEATAKLQVSVDDGATYTDITAGAFTQDVGYTDKKVKFKYLIEKVNPALVNDGDITISGNNIEKGELVRGAAKGCCYIIITVDKPTMLSVSGKVKVGARDIYLTSYVGTLTAEAPSFTLSKPTNIRADGVSPATFVLSKADGFKGDFTVAYQASYGTINKSGNNGGLAAIGDLTEDKVITVTATVTVNNGVYAGTYTLTQDITVYGIPLPTVQWKADSYTVNIGGDVTFADKYDIESTVDVNDGNNHTYSSIETEVTVSEVKNLTEDSDYSIDTGKLTIKETAETKCGGKITLTVTTKINGGNVHSNRTVFDTVDIIIIPQAAPVDTVTVPNGIGAYDVKDAVELNRRGNDIEGWFVKPGDTFDVIGFALDSSAENYGAVNSLVSVSGTMLNINSVITETTSVHLIATVRITSGNYAGTVITGKTTVNVEVLTADGKTVEWIGNKYDTVNVASLLKKGDSALNSTDIAKIDVVIPSEVGYMTVTGSGSDTVLNVDRTCHTYVGATAPDGLNVTLGYDVTLKGGKKYYAQSVITIPPVQITVTGKMDNTDAPSAFDKYPGDVFVISFEASNGFDVTVRGVSGLPTGDDAYLTETHGGNSIVFTASDVAADKSCKVTVTVIVNGMPVTKNYDISVKAPTTSGDYTIGSLTGNSFKANDTNVIESTWKNNGTQYYYGSSLKLTSSTEKLSDFINSVEVVKDSSTKADSSSLSVKTITLSLPYTGRYYKDDYSEFTLKMNVNTNDVIDGAITAELIVYNRNYGGSSKTITATYRISVYARYDVVRKMNDGGSSDYGTKFEVEKGKTYGSTLNDKPTRTGYTFKGWNTSADGTGEVITANTIVDITSTQTLYAMWTPNSYTVKFYETDDTEITSLGAITVAHDGNYGYLPKPEKDGYTFGGWFTDKALSATSNVEDNADISGEPKTKLYAKWDAVVITSFTVTLDANKGTLLGMSSATMTFATGTTFDLSSVIPVREGFTFDGWHDGTSIVKKVTVNGNITLTAQWTAITYEVTYNYNYTDVPETKKVTYGYNTAYNATGKLPANPTREGFKFDGWYTASTGGEKINTADTVTASTTLYAQWKAIYTVSFDANYEGATETFADKTFTEGEGEMKLGDLPVPTAAPIGKKFDGWYPEKSGGEKVSADTAVTATVMLYAHWADITYKVTFMHNNGVADAKTEVTYYYGDNYSAKLPPAPETAPDGKKFDGWYTAATDGTKIDENALAADGQTFFAYWADITYTVTYSYKEGEETKTKPVTYEWNTTYDSMSDEIPAITVPDGKKLIWSETKDGTVGFNMSQTVTGNKTLYAVFVEAD